MTLTRLVSAFAGVSSNFGNNAIVVRGNSPQSLQWKLEGVEISNPNHFADLAAFGGGGITALSAQLLANSDFFSGAMPAEYSNALSGVFDIYMRSGNNQKHEHTFQIGAIGIDAASEGPFKNNSNSSYLLNYRYSTLGLLAPLLPEEAAGTTYQDLSFKLNFPTRRNGTFSLWGIGLLDHSDDTAKQNIADWKYDTDKDNQDVNQYIGALGLSHKILFNHKQYLKTTIAARTNGIDLHTESLDSTLTASPKDVIKNQNYSLILSSFLNTKMNAWHTNRSGIVITSLNYRMNLKKAEGNGGLLRDLVNENGGSFLVSAFTNSMLNINDRIKLNAGVTSQWFSLNDTYTIEPRVGIKCQYSPKQALSFAYGLHSRLERLNYYFITDKQGNFVNNDLGFSRVHHLVLGYDLNISEFLHLKIESYYQHLFGLPVEANSTFSLINQQNDWFVDKQLTNEGTGRNYGIDITFEKYMSQGYYYLVTASVFNSEYKAADKLWRNTRFNRNYALNFLVGKEWLLGKDKRKVLGANVRFSLQGGDHYSPVDVMQSITQLDVVFNENLAFSKQFEPSFTSHFTASYRINKKNTAHEFALKIINLTQYKEIAGFKFNHQTQMVDTIRDPIFIPNFSYKIDF